MINLKIDLVLFQNFYVILLLPQLSVLYVIILVTVSRVGCPQVGAIFFPLPSGRGGSGYLVTSGDVCDCHNS